jgi:Domain of unknown function (DUF4436)
VRKHKADAPHRRKVAIAAVVLIVPIVVASYFLVLVNFRSSRGGSVLGLSETDGLMVFGRVLAVDPEHNEMTLRLNPHPLGSYEGVSGDLVEPVYFFSTGTARDAQDALVTFPAGVPMKSVDVTVELSGEITDYPFDSYTSNTFFYFLRQPSSTEARDEDFVPTQLWMDYALNGYEFEFKDRTPAELRNPRTAHGFDLRVDRAYSTVFFAVFVMALMVTLALASVAIALVLTHWGRDIGPGVLGYLAALLFAFPAIRSVMPGTPPVGSYSDYLAFFWAEAIVASTLLALAIIWLVREARLSASSTDADIAVTTSSPPPGPPSGPPPSSPRKGAP